MSEKLIKNLNNPVEAVWRISIPLQHSEIPGLSEKNNQKYSFLTFAF